MKECFLCKKNYADATNSHIITWALIKEAINLTGFKTRDYEATFTISNFNVPKFYAGASILPERFEEILGHVSSRNKIIENENPLATDNIFCIKCETALGKIESMFIDKIYNKLKKHPFENDLRDSKGNNVFKLTEFDSKLTKLFAYSLFFRTSLVRLSNITLRPEIHEQIRKIIVSALSAEQKDIQLKITEMKDEDFMYPLIISYLVTDEKNISSQNIVMQNRTEMPYFIWANRMIFQLFKKESHVQSSIQNFYGLTNLIQNKDYFQSLKNKATIGIISNSNQIKLVENVLHFMVEENMESARMLLKRAFYKLFQRNPTTKEENSFLYNYSQLYTKNIFSNLKELFLTTFEFTFLNKPTEEKIALLFSGK